MLKKITLVISILFIATISFSQNNSNNNSICDSIKNINIKIVEPVITNNNLKLSGKFLKKSAILQYAAIGSAAVSTCLFYGASKSSDDYDYILYFSGGAMAFASLFLECCSINFKLKAGKHLELSGNKLIVKF